MILDAFAQTRELVRILKSAGPEGTKFFSREKLGDVTLGYAKLYRAILDNPKATEAEIARISLGVGPKDNVYLIQRTVLKDILMNSLFGLDVSEAGFSPYGIAVYDNDRDMFATRILQSFSWPYSVKVASHALPIALSHERWHNALLFIDTLREAAALEGNLTEFGRLKQQYQRTIAIYQAAQDASTALDYLVGLSSKSVSEQPDLTAIGRRAISKLRPKLEKYGTYTLTYLMWQLECAVAQSSGQYVKALELTQEFSIVLERDYPHMVGRPLREQLARKRLTCGIRSRRYEDAMRALDDARLAIVDPGSLNWVMFKQQEYFLLMHVGRYQEAAATVAEVNHDSILNLIPAIHRDKWKLFDAYSRLAVGDQGRRFNRRNLDSRLQMDKAGTNAAAIVLEILLSIRSGQHGELASRLDAITRYERRYLKGAENTQMRRLFRMLESYIRNQHRLSAFERSVHPLIAEHEKDRASDPIEGFQILPFNAIYTWLISDKMP